MAIYHNGHKIISLYHKGKKIESIYHNGIKIYSSSVAVGTSLYTSVPFYMTSNSTSMPGKVSNQIMLSKPISKLKNGLQIYATSIIFNDSSTQDLTQNSEVSNNATFNFELISPVNCSATALKSGAKIPVISFTTNDSNNNLTYYVYVSMLDDSHLTFWAPNVYDSDEYDSVELINASTQITGPITMYQDMYLQINKILAY